jgi:hypothetical protein
LDLVGKANLANLTRYLLVFGALVLLAPYAGCHILTSPPSSLEESSSAPSELEDRSIAETAIPAAGMDDAAARSQAAGTNPPSRSDSSIEIDEIETLLQP